MEQENKPSITDLVDIASEHIEINGQEESRERRLISDFILDNRVRNGDVSVVNSVIYLTFKRWCEKLEYKPLAYLSFFRIFRYYFKPMRHQTFRYYNLNAEPFDLSTEFYFKSRDKKIYAKKED